MEELETEPYVGVIKLITGEILIATVECLEDFTYRISDPLELNTVPVMTHMGMQMAQMAVPWMQNSIDRSFLIAESSVITMGEAKPKLFEDYVNIINSEMYHQQFSPFQVQYDAPVENTISSNPILGKFKENLEKCFNL